MLCSLSPFKARSLIIPFEVFNVVCSETVTCKLKNCLTLSRCSVCVFLVVSTSNVLFFNFLTVFGVPMRASICFSMIKGDRDVIGCSTLSDLMTKNFAKLSEGLYIKEVSISSSESDHSLFCVVLDRLG